MGLFRETSSSRLRASLRGVIPAVVTLVAFLAGRVAIVFALGSDTGAYSAAETLLAQLAIAALYVVLIGGALWSASRLENRPYRAFGLDVDLAWARDFLVGAVTSVTAVLVSVWWAGFRGFAEVDLAAGNATGPGGPVVVALVIIVFLFGQLLFGNVYEEVVYRGILLRNFLEGLVARGVSPAWAAVPATAASLLLFGAYHVPLRGNLVVAVDAALVGGTFALAYLLTGDLGLSLGVHFGRFPLELLLGWEFTVFELSAIVELTTTTPTANLEVKLVRLGLVAAVVLAWVRLVHGEIRVAESIYRWSEERTDAD